MSLSIASLINEVCKSTEDKQYVSSTAIIVDNSGSTGGEMKKNLTILEKEFSIAYELALQSDGPVKILSFHSVFVDHGFLNVDKDIQVVGNMPSLRPEGSTNTILPLEYLLKNISTFKPDKIIIITDGQTNSDLNSLNTVITKLTSYNIEINIIAVSPKNENMEFINSSEEKRIAGMDLVNAVLNNIHNLSIYNNHHYENPFVGAYSSKISKNNINFNGCVISNIPIIVFLDKITKTLLENKTNLRFEKFEDKKILTDTGKLLSLFFIEFPEDNVFILNLIHRYSEIFNMNQDMVLKIIQFGFNCTKSNIPITFTNFETHVRESVVKKQEFKDAINVLKINGFGLNATKLISIPYYNNLNCVIAFKNEINLNKNVKEYPKSKDEKNNVWFGIDQDEQAVRIGLRAFCNEMAGFKNQMGIEVIFYIASMMSLMFIKGVELNTEHMRELKKLAITQLKLDIHLSRTKCAPLYEILKTKQMPPLHFSDSKTPTSLYSNTLLNPLKLSESMWWALMMSMVNLFEEQKENFRGIFELLNIQTQQEFLTHIRETYKENIIGNFQLYDITQSKQSVITLDYFDKTEIVYEISDHMTESGYECRVKSWANEEELNYYLNNGCPWCNTSLTRSQFNQVVQQNINDISNSEKIRFSNISNSNIEITQEFKNLKVEEPIKSNQLSIKSFNKPLSLKTNGNQKFVIFMQGPVGCGKTFFSKKLKNTFELEGKPVLILSMDHYTSQGYDFKPSADMITADLKKSKAKIIVVDLCNDNSINLKKVFNVNLKNEHCILIRPNFTNDCIDNEELLEKYLCWSLKNVLQRNATDSYLNPVNTSFSKCVEVHFKKTQNLFPRSNFKNLTNLTYDEIMINIESKSNEYVNYLVDNYNVDFEISELLKLIYTHQN